MSDKRLDLSVLPDGFLIEVENIRNKSRNPDLDHVNNWILAKNHLDTLKLRNLLKHKFRPALNHWHFNDGSMVLPDGLVIEFQQRDKEILTGSVINGFILVISHGGNIVDEYELEYSEGVAPMFINGDIIAVKIIGVTHEYKEHGSALGMEVIE